MRRVKNLIIISIISLVLVACTKINLSDFLTKINVQSEVKEDFNLPQDVSVDGKTAQVSWTSNNEAVIKVENYVAKVTLPTDDTNVTLTAKVTYDGNSATKDFTVKVLAKYNINRFLDSISLPTEVSDDFNLPPEARVDDKVASLTWVSSNPDVIKVEGNVAKVTQSTVDADATLTVTVTYEGNSVTKDFVVTVLALFNINQFLDFISIPTEVNEDFTLQKEVTIRDKVASLTWVSNNINLIAIENYVADVTLPSADTDVTLTVTVTYDDESIQKDFVVKVLAAGSTTGDKPSDLIYTGYYADITGNFDDFFNVMNGITVSNHTNKLTYGDVWTVLQESDAYDENNIECLYTGRLIPKTDRDGSSSAAVVWNREHVWAKSHGFNNEKYAAYSDAHHLRASEKSINSTRNNSYFDEVVGGSSDAYGNSWTSTVFEPRDEVKGDVARMLFYMVTRYHDSELTLTLDNSGSYGSAPTLGKLSTLVKWHYEDPVDEKEEVRNEVVAKYQGNRNPYIDHPEFVYYLYETESRNLGITEENVLEKVNVEVVEDPTVENLIKDIEAFRDVVITLEHEAPLMALKARYDALSPADKTKVTNYDLLEAKLEELAALMGVVNKSYDLTQAPGNGTSYLKNQTFTIDGLEFYASNHGTGEGFILGANEKNYYAEVDAKYNVGAWARYAILEFSYDNLSSISLTSNGYFSGLNGVVLLYSSDGVTYESIHSFATFEQGDELFYEFGEAKSGHFVLVAYSTSASKYPRFKIGDFTLSQRT